MCGILGVVGRSPNLSWAEQEISDLEHRGPDAKGIVEVNSRVILGATRLAMTDPKPRSNQPMEDPKNRSWIVFNGEIYNYEGLRTELIEEGVLFNTQSDTEVLLKGLGKFGKSFLRRVNGMYSFGYYNASSDVLTLGRDTLGKKPLYYLLDNHNLYFSSSQASLRRFNVRKCVDQNSLVSYLSLGYILDPNTLQEEVKSLQPGHTLETKIGNFSNIKISPIVEEHGNFSESGLSDNLRLAIERRISGHEEVGISLSGGYDSTLIAILLSEYKVKVRSYSAVWIDSDKLKYNLDSEYARKTSSKLGFEHRDVEIFDSSKLSSMLEKYLVSLQEPNNNSTGLSMMNLYAAAQSDGLRLMLTGDGADELLGGYSRYEQYARLPSLFNIPSNIFNNYVLNNHSKLSAKLLSAQLDSCNFAKWIPWQMVFTPNELAELVPRIKKRDVVIMLSESVTGVVQYTSENNLANFMNFDLQTWLTMESNRRLDRVSMAHSIEARSPFQDSFFRQAARLEMKRTSFTAFKKDILTDNFEVLRDFEFPKEKAGFISPIGHWLRNNPELVKNSLFFLQHNEGFGKTILDRLSTSPHRGDFRDLVKLWTLVVYSQWRLLNGA